MLRLTVDEAKAYIAANKFRTDLTEEEKKRLARAYKMVTADALKPRPS